jgi:DNA-binding winged helix-turn-helix (wHTH) protein
MGGIMTTKTAVKCYRFEGIDFIPEDRLLRWHDNQQILLTDDESRFLASLCHLAGEVVSIESVYRYTFIYPNAFEDSGDHHYDLNILLLSLSKKLFRHGKMAIPIYIIPSYGFRVSLPNTAAVRNETSILKKAPSWSNIVKKHTRKPFSLVIKTNYSTIFTTIIITFILLISLYVFTLN